MYTVPKVNPFLGAGIQSGLSFSPESVRGADFSGDPQKSSFKDVMTNMVQDMDRTLSMPDDLMNRALTHGDVDLHEVMIANTKADISVNIAAQVVTKVIQAYERVQQIQV